MIRYQLILVAAAIPLALAQNLAPTDQEADPVIAALTENIDGEPVREGTTDKPLLVTGTPPEGAEIENAPQPMSEPEGVTVQVEPGKGSAGKVSPSSVKLLAPFPAKPLSQPPAGWRLEHPEDIPSFTREVQLDNGTRIPLSIRPHLLVPDADGEHVIGVHEPGYDPALGYAQAGTMSAILANSVERMEEDSRQLGDALDRLGQLLSSLPATEDEPATPAKEAPTPDKKKR